jgi:hypothetical protein
MIMARPRRSFLFILPLVCGVIVLSPVSVGTQASDKSVFVAITDASGQPVRDMKVSEFAVREDNVMREVVGLKPATQPLYLYILADTSRQAGNQGMMGRETATGGTELIRDIRGSLTEAVRTLYKVHPEAQTALMEFGQAAIPIVKFTNKLQDVERGITRLYPKPEAGSVILEALIEAAKQLSKVPSPRRAIISLNIEPGEEESRQEPQKILDGLRASGATLWAVSLQKGALRNPARDIVLNRLTEISGGRREFIIGPSAIKAMLTLYAEVLASQYELTYKRPATSADVQVMQVGTTRQGVKVHATFFAPK